MAQVQRQIEIRLRAADYCDSVRVVLEAGKVELENKIQSQFEKMQVQVGMLNSKDVQVKDLLKVQVIDNVTIKVLNKDLVKCERHVKFWKGVSLVVALAGGYIALKK